MFCLFNVFLAVFSDTAAFFLLYIVDGPNWHTVAAPIYMTKYYIYIYI